MKTLLINGPVVDDSDVWFYDYLEEACVSPSKVREFLAESEGVDIQVSINSGGGSVFAGSEIYTLLKEYSGRVDVVVSGLAGSIASVIMLAGDTVKASPMAQVMIHNASMRAHGDYRDFEHASVVIGGVSQSLVSLYSTKTGLSAADIKEMVDKETWLNAERAKELGFIDEILFSESVSLAASCGSYFPKDKIMELKSRMAAEERSNPLDSILNRLSRIEECLEGVVAQSGSAVEAESTVEKRKAASPFGKFFK